MDLIRRTTEQLLAARAQRSSGSEDIQNHITDHLCQGQCRLMAPSGSSLPYGSDSSGVHGDHSGAAGSCKPSLTEHHRSGNDLSTCGDKSTDALETSPQECSPRRNRQVPSQARGLSAPGVVCSGLSSRILVDMQDMPSTLASEPTRVSGESDDAQDDFECAFARAHMSLHTRFESHEQLQMLRMC
eukprot:1850242-Amphidinium_carterae.1